MKILDVGCGNKKAEGAVGIDFIGNTNADVLHDLNAFPYPFTDNDFDKIVCSHVMEHIENVVKVMEELHRIGKNGAEVVIRTPHFSSLNSWVDPTHKHHFALDSFDYFTEDANKHTYYSTARFKILEKQITFGDSLLSMIPKIICLFSLKLYEKHFAFVFPAYDVFVRLQILK